MWSRSPVVGDSFYTGGAYSGELGSWTVTVIGMNQWYLGDGWDVWARNVTEGSRSGTCIQHGDSGGPVFTLTTGGVSAKGIISGMGLVEGERTTCRCHHCMLAPDVCVGC